MAVTIAAAVQTVRAEIECPRCRSRYILLSAYKCSCRQCGNVWSAANPPRKFEGGA